MVYDVIDFDYEGSLLPAYDKIFQSRKKVRNEFAAYELIDNHPKK
jgi:hypothetical protein